MQIFKQQHAKKFLMGYNPSSHTCQPSTNFGCPKLL